MSQIPRDKSPDSTLALFFEGYKFGSKRFRRYQSDIFETRLMLRKTVCLRGEEAARIFYDESRFQRQGALPRRGLKSFLGEGGVQTLDGDAHLRRKQMFMSLMTPESIRQLTDLMAGQWGDYTGKWEKMKRVVLFDEVSEILCRAVCRWVGVPLNESEVKKRANDFVAMIDSPAALGPRHWRGRLARSRAEKWIGDIIENIRADKLEVSEGSGAHVVAWHRELNGELLDRKVAAVELINLLRPVVAVALYVTFVALALHEHPESRQKIRAGEDEYAELFVQEVRRFYPFFPFVAAIAKTEFNWRGYSFPGGRWVILDLYGTDHDPEKWEKPEEFQPERFRRRKENPYDFIPQGGGDHYRHHRCAGEWVTIELMKVALRLLTGSMEYEVPPQDLRIKLSRVPAIPESRFVINNVRRRIPSTVGTD
jgi:fatty-acid peroxygenase